MPIERILTTILFFSVASLAAVGQTTVIVEQGQDDKGDKTVRMERGKWSGEATFSGGANFERQDEENREGRPFFTNMNGEGSVKAGYATDVFYINGLVNCSSSARHIDRTGYTGNLGIVTQEGTHLKSNVEFADNFSKNLNLGGSLNAGWRPDRRNKFDFSYKYSMNRNTPYKQVKAATCDSYIDDIENFDTLSLENVNVKLSSENTLNKKTNHSFTLKYLHDLDKPGKTLEAVLDADFGIMDNSTEYEVINVTRVGDTAQFGGRKYRITPVYYDNSTSLSVHYRDKRFADVTGLDVDFFFKMDFKSDIDEFSAANCHDEVWIDSTGYAAKYRNHEYKPAPGFNLSWSGSKFGAAVSYSPQFFFYNIFDSEHTGKLYMGATAHYVDLKGTYRLWTGHSFDLVFKRDYTRPDYLQLCPFERNGSSASESIMGNPDLKPAAKNKLSLLYNYTHGRFSTLLETGLTHENRKIVQTIIITEDEQKSEKRIRTWKNAEDGYTANAKLSLFWKGSVLKADLSANLNYFYGIKENGGDTRSSDWSLKGNVSYQLKTWLFNAGLNYQSKIIRQYISMTEIVGLDLKVEKKFGRFSVAIEGKNLLDRNVVVLTESDDGLQGRYEDTDNNNRHFLLGLKYAF